MKNWTRKKSYILLAIVLIAAFIVDVAVRLGSHSEHVHTAGSFPGFYIIYGFVGGWVLILVAKKLLGPAIQKDEDYYDGGEDHD